MSQSTLLKDAVELFLLDVQSSGRSRETTIFYRRQLKPFLAWLAASDNPPIHLHELAADHFRRYLLYRQQRVKASTVHASARAIRAFCNYCTRDGLLDASPFAAVTMPRLPRPLPEALSEADLRQLVRACHLERDKAILYFLADSGMRAFELTALNVVDVDLTTGAVTVQYGKGAKGRVT